MPTDFVAPVSRAQLVGKRLCPNDKTDTVVRGRTVKTGSGLGLINEEKNCFRVP